MLYRGVQPACCSLTVFFPFNSPYSGICLFIPAPPSLFLLRVQSKRLLHKDTQTDMHTQRILVVYTASVPSSLMCAKILARETDVLSRSGLLLLLSIRTYRMRDVFYEHELTNASHCHLHVFHVLLHDSDETLYYRSVVVLLFGTTNSN